MQVTEIAREMCASRDGGANFFKDCSECPCDGGCLYQELSASLRDYRKFGIGEWVENGDGTYYCSNCGNDATYTYDGTEICGVACPFCGASMKGVTDGKAD